MSDVFYITGNGDPRDWQLHDTWGDAYDTIRPDLEAGGRSKPVCVLRVLQGVSGTKPTVTDFTEEILRLAAIEASCIINDDGGTITVDFPYHLIDYAPQEIQQMAETRWANEARADDE